MKTVIWLDDLRCPEEYTDEVYRGKNNIFWCKNMKEFTHMFPKLNVDMVWFDHDLKPEHYTPKEYWDSYYESDKYQRNQNHTETGYDCAAWMVKYCSDNGIEIPMYKSQSANPVGRDRIMSLLNWEKKENTQI